MDLEGARLSLCVLLSALRDRDLALALILHGLVLE
jgi:hypothetical protein